MRELNESVPDRLSDHAPMTVDRPLLELDVRGEAEFWARQQTTKRLSAFRLGLVGPSLAQLYEHGIIRIAALPQDPPAWHGALEHSTRRA